MKIIKFLAFAMLLLCCTVSCSMLKPTESQFQQPKEALLTGEVMAVAYSGYREGQHPDRGEGAVNPDREQILEDLRILVREGFKLIRVYDARENSKLTLELIREHKLPLKVMLGMWIDAELSNHEGCPWLDKPIPAAKLAANKIANQEEVVRGIGLANAFPDVVVAVNVGNEALINWTDHLVEVDSLIAYVRQVKAAIKQPVTVAENYVWWIEQGKALAQELDFVGVHTYPVWEEKDIDDGLAYMLRNIEDVRAALPNSSIAILETGWATTASEFGGRANEANQVRYYKEVKDWAEKTNTTVFFFEAFDEPWKGNPDNAQGAEKHWGLFFVDRTPKQVMQK